MNVKISSPVGTDRLVTEDGSAIVSPNMVPKAIRPKLAAGQVYAIDDGDGGHDIVVMLQTGMGGRFGIGSPLVPFNVDEYGLSTNRWDDTERKTGDVAPADWTILVSAPYIKVP